MQDKLLCKQADSGARDNKLKKQRPKFVTCGEFREGNG
jgi:hypothetical protein